MSLSSFNDDFWKLINKKTQRSWYAISSSWNEDMRGAWSSCAGHDDQSDWVVVCGVSCVQLYCLLAGDIPLHTAMKAGQGPATGAQCSTVSPDTQTVLPSHHSPAHFRSDIAITPVLNNLWEGERWHLQTGKICRLLN